MKLKIYFRFKYSVQSKKKIIKLIHPVTFYLNEQKKEMIKNNKQTFFVNEYIHLVIWEDFRQTLTKTITSFYGVCFSFRIQIRFLGDN